MREADNQKALIRIARILEHTIERGLLFGKV